MNDNQLSKQVSLDDIKIAICYFMKEEHYIKHQCCLPRQVGADVTKVEFGIQQDNVNENISYKNPFYCEFTGIYWLWKNVDSKYKGVMHHRRFLSLDKEPVSLMIKRLGFRVLNKLYNCYKYHPASTNKKILCNSNEEFYKRANKFLDKLPDLLSCYEIVTIEPFHYSYRKVGQAFADVVNRPLLKCLRELFQTEYSEYSLYFEKTLKSEKLYYGNISVMSSVLFNQYCSFVFGMLDKLEKKLVYDDLFIQPLKEKSLSRVFGYIGELLTNTFIIYSKEQGTKILELPLLFNAKADHSRS